MPLFSADRRLHPVSITVPRSAASLLLCVLAFASAAAELPSYEAGEAALVRGDYATAWRILGPLAEAGDARAQNDVGVMYGRGLGVPQSYSQALVWITRSAEHGNAQAQSTLGYMYYRARGVERDLALAALWTRRAAEQGVAAAQSGLGLLYDKGQGVEQDYAEAARWYRRAAEQGFAEAQRNLGSMYEHGNGVPVDPLLAYAWYGVASAGGDELALRLRARVAARMSEAEVEQARGIARELHWRYGAHGHDAP